MKLIGKQRNHEIPLAWNVMRKGHDMIKMKKKQWIQTAGHTLTIYPAFYVPSLLTFALAFCLAYVSLFYLGDLSCIRGIWHVFGPKRGPQQSWRYGGSSARPNASGGEEAVAPKIKRPLAGGEKIMISKWNYDGITYCKWTRTLA